MSTPNPATTPWVPLWDLNGAVGLTYYGDWVAGNYKDGDIVIYQGITYMCVRPTSVAPARWDSPVLQVPVYSTSLPASPVDGQEAILVDSITNPTYQWRFRYNAGSTSPYRWEYIGGVGLRNFVAAHETTTSSSFVALTTPGPSLTAPRAGEYILEIAAYAYSLTAGDGAFMGVFLNGVDTGYAAFGGASFYNHVFFRIPLTVPTAGLPLVALYKAPLSGTAVFGQRSITITPIRVS